MRPTILFFLLFLVITHTSAQQINPDLKSKLDLIAQKDQDLRKLFTSITKGEKDVILQKYGYSWMDFEEQGWKIVAKQDSINLDLISKIISKHGYPGKTLVGTPTNEAAWYVIQHSNQIEKFLPIIKKAGKKKEIPMTLVAMMEDRKLMYEGLEQKYGTQLKSGIIQNPKTGEKKWQFYIWPVKSPELVNDLRKKAGFKTTIEEYANSKNIEYINLTLEDLGIYADD